jgi:non-ribosomal peptide synthetase component F
MDAAARRFAADAGIGVLVARLEEVIVVGHRSFIIDAIRAAAARHPEAAAVCGPEPEAVVTYAQLMCRVDGLAQQLRQHGVVAGQRVAVLLDHSPELIVAILGALVSGAAYVPLDPRAPVAQLEQILRDCQPSVLLAELSCDPLAVACDATLLPPGRWRSRSGGIPIDEGDASATADLAAAAPRDPIAYLLYPTSASGAPERVAISHPSLDSLLEQALASNVPVRDRGVPSVSSLDFDPAATCCFPRLMRGEPLFLSPRAEPVEHFPPRDCVSAAAAQADAPS